MKALLIAGALALTVFGAGVPAFAQEKSGTADEQRDCTNDALNYCGQYIWLPPKQRDPLIGACLWKNRNHISPACRSHLHQPAK